MIALIVVVNDREWIFRSVDVGCMSKELVQSISQAKGKEFFDSHNSVTYLKVPGIGYAILR